MTVSEAADALGVHPSTIYRMIESGKILNIIKGREQAVWRADVERLLAQGYAERKEIMRPKADKLDRLVELVERIAERVGVDR